MQERVGRMLKRHIHSSRIDVAVPYKNVIVVYILGPIATILRHADIQPRLHVSVVVDDCSRFDVLQVHLCIVPKAQNMPPVIDGNCMVVECY